MAKLKQLGLTLKQQQRLDEAESHPAPGNPSLTIRQEKERVGQLKIAFAAKYRVHEMRQSFEHFYKFIESGGHAPPKTKGNRSTRGFDCWRWICSSPIFDHCEIWGQGRSPMILVGHPYDDVRIKGDNRLILDKLRSYGLDIQENGPESSHYGFGSVQFLVFAHGFLAECQRRWAFEAMDAADAAERSVRG